MADTVFRIQRPDGSFRGEGHEGGKKSGQRKVKTWRRRSDVKNHLKMAGGDGRSVHRLSSKEIARNADAAEDVVIEYELREIRRVPVTDFLDDVG